MKNTDWAPGTPVPNQDVVYRQDEPEGYVSWHELAMANGDA